MIAPNPNFHDLRNAQMGKAVKLARLSLRIAAISPQDLYEPYAKRRRGDCEVTHQPHTSASGAYVSLIEVTVVPVPVTTIPLAQVGC